MSTIGIYAIIAVIGAALMGGLVHSYNSGQEAKAQLSQCKATNDTLNSQISRQNAAVESLSKASQEAAQRAQKALASARKAVASTEPERQRLAALQSQAKLANNPICPAGAAVAEIRKGLK